MYGINKTVYLQKYLLHLMWISSSKKTIIYILLCVGAEMFPLIELLVWKNILDYLVVVYQTRHFEGMFFLAVVGYLILRAVPKTLAEIRDVLYEDIKRKIALQIDHNLFDKLPKMGLGFLDNPINRDIVENIQQSEESIAAAAPWVIGALISLLSMVVSLIIFLSYGLVFGCVFVCTYIPSAFISFKNKQMLDKFSIDSIPDSRKKNYYKSLLTSVWPAKELRIYAAISFFKDKYFETRDTIRRERKKVFIKGALEATISSVISSIGVVFILGGSIYQILQGNISLGTMILYIGLTQTIGTQVESVIESFSLQFAFAFPAVERYISFQKMNELTSNPDNKVASGDFEIVFDNVSFRYPGSSDWILKDFNLKIKSNEIIAIAGVNGAGKSTIVKLLLHLYEPTNGKITWNGIPYSDISLEELHKLFSICFQEITHYAMPFASNICISDCDKNISQDHLQKTINDAGLNEIFLSLPNGMDTHMTKQFYDDGVELSGGQWQRIGIARSMYRDAKMLIMDEPSAALDVMAEEHIFAAYRDTCKGKSGLLITHRLSNLMYADRIVFIENGKICEEGTHEELLQKRGKYYTLYSLQAEKYSKGME